MVDAIRHAAAGKCDNPYWKWVRAEFYLLNPASVLLIIFGHRVRHSHTSATPRFRNGNPTSFWSAFVLVVFGATASVATSWFLSFPLSPPFGECHCTKLISHDWLFPRHKLCYFSESSSHLMTNKHGSCSCWCADHQQEEKEGGSNVMNLSHNTTVRGCEASFVFRARLSVSVRFHHLR